MCILCMKYVHMYEIYATSAGMWISMWFNKYCYVFKRGITCRVLFPRYSVLQFTVFQRVGEEKAKQEDLVKKEQAEKGKF